MSWAQGHQHEGNRGGEFTVAYAASSDSAIG